MINLNGIQIDEAELKRQLEAQGYDCDKREPGPKRGDVYWVPMKITGTDVLCGKRHYCFAAVDSRPIPFVNRDPVLFPCEGISALYPDELIRAYEKLHKYSGELGAEASCHNLFIISAAIYKKIQNMYGEINALKAQGEKR